MYRPLPEILTIKKSPIEGLGLYALKDIKANTYLGITHILDERFDNKYIRTPLGGFYNHSNNPNIQRIKTAKIGAYKASDRYGVWLAKDYIPIENVNQWIKSFGYAMVC